MFGESWTVRMKQAGMGLTILVLIIILAGFGGLPSWFLFKSGAELGNTLNFAGGIIGGAVGSGLAVLGAQYLARSERHASRHAETHGVARAVNDALVVLGDASKTYLSGTKRSQAVVAIASRAMFTEERLRRLILRSELSDEAIEIGTCAIAIMEIVQQAAEIIEKGKGVDVGTRAKRWLGRADVLRISVATNLIDVRLYLKRRRGLVALWPT